jgi:hypothetical protein
MTKNLKLFALYSLATAILFFATLNWELYNPHKRGVVLALVDLVAIVGFSLMGRYLGKRDRVNQRSVRYSLGVRYGLTAPLIVTIVGVIWILVWRRTYWSALISYAITIILCILVGFYVSRKWVKGSPKGKLFK